MEFSPFKNESKKTGGGPPLKPPSQSNQQIIEIIEDTPAFAGLRGTDRALNGVVPLLRSAHLMKVRINSHVKESLKR